MYQQHSLPLPSFYCCFSYLTPIVLFIFYALSPQQSPVFFRAQPYKVLQKICKSLPKGLIQLADAFCSTYEVIFKNSVIFLTYEFENF